MIERYSLPRMSAIWSEENKFRKMLEVELFACEALAKLGKIPKSSLFQIRKRARFDGLFRERNEIVGVVLQAAQRGLPLRGRE